MIKIYVSAQGNDDTADGSKSNPFATIAKAQDKSRKFTNEDKMIIVEEGKYFISSPIKITDTDNNTTFKANGQVNLCGAMTLNINEWSSYKGNIKVAQIQAGLDIDCLFVNGVHQILARFPNYIDGVVPLGSVTNEEQIKKRVRNYKCVKGSYIRAIHEYGWGGNSYIVTGKDDNSPLGLSLKWVGDNNRGSKYDPEKLLIENVLEELDCENEWYYDKQSGKLYYYPPKDLNLGECTIKAAINSDIFKLENAKDVVIDGFSISKTPRTMFTVDKKNKKYVPLLRGDWTVVRAGTVLIENSENVDIINCDFSEIYGNAVFLSGKNKGHKIDNNEFSNIGASCVQIVGLKSSVYEPSFWEHDLYKNDKDHIVHKTKVDYPDKKGPKTDEYPHNIVISNNHMNNMGIYEKQSCGINISMSKNIKILHNTIHNSARSCINVNDGTFGGHIIAYNDIFDSQKETTDHGPFNSWGRDRYWSVPKYDTMGNNGETAKRYALLDVIEPIKIHNNRFHHSSYVPQSYHSSQISHSWGIDLDDGSSNYEIYNNLCLGVGVKLREGFYRNVCNNIIIDGKFNIHCTYKGADDKIYKNVVIKKSPWGFAGMTGGDEKRLSDGNYKVNNNCYYSPKGRVTLPNIWDNLGFDSTCTVNIDPQFKDISKNDYTITNKDIINKIGFENFDMNNFGKPNCKYKSPIYDFNQTTQEKDLNETQWNGAIISNINHAIMSATATNGTNGVYFKDVRTDSQAYKMGYRTNNIIKEINGEKVDDVNQFIKLINL